MLDIRNKMAEQGREISDTTFINAISASITEPYRDVIQSLQTNLAQANAGAEQQITLFRASLQAMQGFPVQNLPQFTPRTLTSAEVVTALRQKAASKAALAKSHKKPHEEGQANYSGKGNQRFRG